MTSYEAIVYVVSACWIGHESKDDTTALGFDLLCGLRCASDSFGV